MRAFSSHQNHERKSVPCSTYFLTPSCQDLTPDPYFPDLLKGSDTLAGYTDPSKPAYLYRAALLAQDIPALSWPAGSVKVKDFYKTQDLMALKTPEADAPWPRISPYRDYKNQTKRWYHGDYRAQAYLYTYRLYDLFVTEGGLKN